MSLCGSLRIISRSLHVPGSDSSAFTTKKFGRPSLCFGMNEYLRPDGNPAPPRPRRPESLISWISQSGPMFISSLV
jgi:hypothetical protein